MGESARWESPCIVDISSTSVSFHHESPENENNLENLTATLFFDYAQYFCIYSILLTSYKIDSEVVSDRITT